jgi:hypothetical protein
MSRNIPTTKIIHDTTSEINRGLLVAIDILAPGDVRNAFPFTAGLLIDHVDIIAFIA